MPDTDSKLQEPTGTPEHLAVRHLLPSPDPMKAEIKQQLRDLRAEITRLLTALHWEGKSVTATANAMIPLLNLGNVEQWKEVIIPFLHEIDRGGTLIPVWIEIILRGDPPNLSLNANPAETMEGRARRFAILMLGNYKTVGIRRVKLSQFNKEVWRTQPLSPLNDTQDLAQFLGFLATDSNTSLYATQALLRHANIAAMQALVEALRSAKGWAKVDVVEALLSLQQEQFYVLLMVSGLDNVAGLESYIATSLYRTIPLAGYLSAIDEVRETSIGNPANTTASSHLQQQAALIFHQVLQDTLNQPLPTNESTPLPIAFEQHLPTLANALFTGTQRHPQWQNIVALHRLNLLIEHYWHAITQNQVLTRPVLEQVEQCLPHMNEIKRWMNSQGREALISTPADTHEDHQHLRTGVLQELAE